MNTTVDRIIMYNLYKEEN